MSWLALILALLKVAENLTSWLQTKKLLDAGADQEIARASISVLQKTHIAKRLLEKVNALNEAEIDDMLLDLEPRDTRNVRPDDSSRR